MFCNIFIFNNAKLIFACFMGFLLLGVSPGCQKLSCCGYPSYSATCTKDSISVFISVFQFSASNQSMINDSVKAYQAQGYTCNIVSAQPFTSECEVGIIEINKAKHAGEVCTTPFDAYCRNSSNDPECGP